MFSKLSFRLLLLTYASSIYGKAFRQVSGPKKGWHFNSIGYNVGLDALSKMLGEPAPKIGKRSTYGLLSGNYYYPRPEFVRRSQFGYPSYNWKSSSKGLRDFSQPFFNFNKRSGGMQPNYMSIRNQHPSDPSSNLGPQLQQAQHQNIDKKWEPMFNFYSGHPEKRDAHPVESLIAQESVAHNSPTENAMFYRTVIPIDRFYAPTLGFNFEGIEMPNEIDYEYMIPVETAPASLGAKNWLGGLKIESGSRSEISAKKPKLSFCCSIFNPSFPQYPTPKVKRDNYDPDSSKNINSLTNFFLDPNKRDFVNFQPLEDTFLRDHIQDSLYFY